MIKKMSHSVVTILLILFFLISCSPVPFKPYTPPSIQYDKLDQHNIEETLAIISKPEKLQPIYVILKGNEVEQLSKERIDEATHILLVPSEYAKVGGLVKLASSYKSIAIEQGVLVNTYIDQVNALREMLVIERQKALLYRELWTETENIYRQEMTNRKRNDRINKIKTAGIVGSIIVLAIAL